MGLFFFFGCFFSPTLSVCSVASSERSLPKAWLSAELSGRRQRGFLAPYAWWGEVGHRCPFLHRQADALRTGDAFLSISPSNQCNLCFVIRCTVIPAGGETQHKKARERQTRRCEDQEGDTTVEKRIAMLFASIDLCWLDAKSASVPKLFCYHMNIWRCQQAKTNTDGEWIHFSVIIRKKKQQERSTCVNLELARLRRDNQIKKNPFKIIHLIYAALNGFHLDQSYFPRMKTISGISVVSVAMAMKHHHPIELTVKEDSSSWADLAHGWTPTYLISASMEHLQRNGPHIADMCHSEMQTGCWRHYVSIWTFFCKLALVTFLAGSYLPGFYLNTLKSEYVLQRHRVCWAGTGCLECLPPPASEWHISTSRVWIGETWCRLSRPWWSLDFFLSTTTRLTFVVRVKCHDDYPLDCQEVWCRHPCSSQVEMEQL